MSLAEKINTTFTAILAISRTKVDELDGAGLR
jgi:hypothetical protein